MVIRALTFSDAKARLSAVLTQVVEDRLPVAITRAKAEAVVFVSLADWSAMVKATESFPEPPNDRTSSEERGDLA
jgi:antitoxin YefM